MLEKRVLQVWRWYLQRFRRYRKKTRGGLEIAPPVGRGLTSPYLAVGFKFLSDQHPSLPTVTLLAGEV